MGTSSDHIVLASSCLTCSLTASEISPGCSSLGVRVFFPFKANASSVCLFHLFGEQHFRGLFLATENSTVTNTDCLSHCPVAMKRHHDQGYLQKKVFIWGIAYRFRGLVSDHHGGEHGHIQANIVLEK